jgi:hypothetical protein
MITILILFLLLLLCARRIAPIPQSTTQRITMPFLSFPMAGEGYSMCNSVKLHFFRETVDGMEVRRDFLYSSSFPLDRLQALASSSLSSLSPVSEGGGGGGGGGSTSMRLMFGLFNYNTNVESIDPLADMRLVLLPGRRSSPHLLLPGVVDTTTTSLNRIPHNVVVYAVQGEPTHMRYTGARYILQE